MEKTYLGSWPVKQEEKYYQITQDIKGIKDIELLRDHVVLLEEDGQLNGFRLVENYELENSVFSTHIRSLKNIERIKTSRHFNRIYTWSADQGCFLHEINNEKIEQTLLGKEIVDVLCGDSWSLTDITVSKNGVLTAIPEKDQELFDPIKQLINQVNTNLENRLTDYKKGYLFAIDYQNEASILWMDNGGHLHYIQEGARHGTYVNNYYWDKESYELKLPLGLDPVDDFLPDEFQPEGKDFLVLSQGKLKHLSLVESKNPELEAESGIYELAEQSAIKSIKSPVVKITRSGLALFENGRAVEVTVHALSAYKTAWRDRFKKKSISSEKYIVKNARIIGNTVFAIVENNLSAIEDCNSSATLQITKPPKIKIIETIVHSGGFKEIVLDCSGETSSTSPLRIVRVYDGLTYADGNHRRFVGERTNMFDHTTQSKQRLKLIKQINYILDNQQTEES